MSGKRGASPVSRHYNELPEGLGGDLRRYVSRSPSAGVGSGEGAGAGVAGSPPAHAAMAAVALPGPCRVRSMRTSDDASTIL